MSYSESPPPEVLGGAPQLPDSKWDNGPRGDGRIFRSDGVGYLSFRICGSRFDIDSRYELVKAIGQGAYGLVCAAVDSGSCERPRVAIKKLRRVFDHLSESKRALREIKLLRCLRHENIVSITDVFLPPRPPRIDPHDFHPIDSITADRQLAVYDDVYIVCDLMDTDLAQIIASPQPLTAEHARYLTYQLLRGVKYIHSAGIVHRDLKPSNLLLNASCDLKICDFGLSRSIRRSHAGANTAALSPSSPEAFSTCLSPGSAHLAPGRNAVPGHLSDYVATRWYRAPEIMLGQREYTASIDMWSIGCILAEMFLRRPLFPGKDYYHQIVLIADHLGAPPAATVAALESRKAKRFLAGLHGKTKRTIPSVFPASVPEQALDLLDKVLAWDPATRPTAAEALAHPWFSGLHDADDEPEADPMQLDWEWESAKGIDDIRALILGEMLRFRAERESK